MDWRLALVVAGGDAAGLRTRWCGSAGACAPRNETSLRRWRDISEILQETISGFRVVKAFGMEGFEIARFRRAAARLFNVNMRITRTTAILPPLMEAVGGLALVGALFYGSHSIRSRPPHHRRLRLVPGRALRDVHADQAPLARERHPAGRAGRGRAHLRGARHPRGGPGGARTRSRCRACRREIEYRDVGFRYADGHGGRAAQRQLHGAGGRGGGHRGHERGGQDDAREPAAALLRRDARAPSSSTGWTSATSPWTACATRSAS